MHLGFNDRSNVLRGHLEGHGFAPEKCDFRLIAYGPILEEATTLDQHRGARDVIAGLEKALADAMIAARYSVLNTVYSKKPVDLDLLRGVISAFSSSFDRLENV